MQRESNSTVSGAGNPDPSCEGELLDEALAGSFPASDPPAFSSLHAGLPRRAPLPESPPPRPPPLDGSGWVALAGAEGLFFLASGLWPVAHLRSFEAVTGPKVDRWLVKTVGLLLATIGGALVIGSRFKDRNARRALGWLAMATPASVAAIDIVYVAKKRISKVYLLDAAIEMAFVFGWARTWASDAREQRR